MINWKNVKDELPKETKEGEEATNVLVILYGGVYQGYFMDGFFWYGDCGDEKDEDKEIVYWTELNMPED